MKRIVSYLLALVMIVSVMTVPSYADNQINVTIDGAGQNYDVMPVNISGRVLVPMRGIFEALGAEVEWRDDLKTVYAAKGGKNVVVTIDSPNARIDGIGVKMDVAPAIIEGRTMVPVRFVSEAMGEDVEWDDSTKTVIITRNKNSGLKKLISDIHREVPSEFEKTNDFTEENLLYFEHKAKDNDILYKDAVTKAYTEIFSLKDLKGKMSDESYGRAYFAKSDSGEEVFKFEIDKVAEKSGNCIYLADKTLEGLVSPSSNCLFAVTLRTVSGGDERGIGKIQVQLENKENYQKDIWLEVYADKEWTTVYFPYFATSSKKRFHLGIRPAFYNQVVEIKDFRILDFKDEIKAKDLPSTVGGFDDTPYLPGQKWRKDAIDRIEKIRKGDFNVVVLDKNGNPVKDAEVELDMFEHEFEFGVAFKGTLATDEKYQKAAASMFNAGVDEGYMKWQWYENGSDGTNGHEYRALSQNMVKKAKELGIRYYRGHSLMWDIEITPSGNRMVPQDVGDATREGNREYVQKRSTEYIQRIMNDFVGELTDWDAVNETATRDNEMQTACGGYELQKLWWDTARKTEPGIPLYYNEDIFAGGIGNKDKVWQNYFDVLDKMKEAKIEYDGLGIQCHMDKADYTLDVIMDAFSRIKEYGKQLRVTEYSCSVEDEILQANYTRDFMLLAFSEEMNKSFISWNFVDGMSFQNYSNYMYSDYTLKPAGKVYQDLVYNKWWTKDAKATTDATGKSTVRGYYGDYDVTVTANGKTIKETVSFHKGYDNTLYITIE